MGDAAAAVGSGEVTTALEEAVEGLLALDGEVVVGTEHGRVDKGSEHRVDAVFVS